LAATVAILAGDHGASTTLAWPPTAADRAEVAVNTLLEMTITTTTTTVVETMEVARRDPVHRPMAEKSGTPIQEPSTEEAVLAVPRLAVTLTITFTGIEGTITVLEEDSAIMEDPATIMATIMDTTTTTTAETGAATTVTVQERTSAATSTAPTTVLNPTLDTNLSYMWPYQ